MGTSQSGRYLNTYGTGRSISDFALVHSNEGSFTRSQTRMNGKMVVNLRLHNGGHGQKGMDLLDKYGIEYHVIKTYTNGVRIGYMILYAVFIDRKSTRLNSSHVKRTSMPSSA